MKIICNPQDLDKQGVYVITCKSNNKIYVGSTTMSFIKRFHHHNSQLINNNHKNSYLQKSWNKYGKDNFEFDILEICNKQECLKNEQRWINETNCIDKTIGFNINPLASGTPNLSKETIKKRNNTISIFRKECKEYYIKLKNNEIIFENIPLKFQKSIKRWITIVYNDGQIKKGFEPWNKGIKYNSTNHLKVSKTITPKLKQAWKNTSIRNRAKYPKIKVYDKNMNFLGQWDSAKDIEEFSYTSENNLPIKSRFSGEERLGIPCKVLQSVNINKSCKTKQMYKNLYFRYDVPTQKGISEVLSTNIGESL